MSMSIGTFRTAMLSAAAAAVIAVGSNGAARAQHHGHGGWHGGWGPGFVGGLAAGAAIGTAPYYYGGPYAYDYGGCYVRRQVVINRWGQRVIRHVRVCD
jgi:hypothetical protein